ncbi:MAG: DNA adenine methylase [Dehalococcoidia bacterium]|nr:DNA adenine methylase [Dehalococcoidia bacterium]
MRYTTNEDFERISGGSIRTSAWTKVNTVNTGTLKSENDRRLQYVSPLRYPGGKGALADFISHTIELNNLFGCAYFEPFAGGAGAALRLLLSDVVSELHLNDYDARIAAFWKAVLNEPERFTEAILSVPLSIPEWYRQRAICRRADTGQPFELGFATFYLNRCNRSGIIRDATPIGGYGQEGKWRMDARFPREGLAERVRAISNRREQIHITSLDAKVFLVQRLPRGHTRKNVFVYLDPPYFSNGSHLYMNSYNNQDHAELARYIQRQVILHWMMSYDDCDFIRNLYKSCRITHISLQYSLQQKRRASELLIAPSHVEIPTDVDSAEAEVNKGEDISLGKE